LSSLPNCFTCRPRRQGSCSAQTRTALSGVYHRAAPTGTLLAAARRARGVERRRPGRPQRMRRAGGRSLLAELAFRSEKGGQDGSTALGKDAAKDTGAVIEARVGRE